MASIESFSFRVGAIVWARLEGYPWWPARVVCREKAEIDLPLAEMILLRRETPYNRVVSFFNDNDSFGVIELCDICDYVSNMHLLNRNDPTVVAAAREASAFVTSLINPEPADMPLLPEPSQTSVRNAGIPSRETDSLLSSAGAHPRMTGVPPTLGAAKRRRQGDIDDGISGGGVRVIQDEFRMLHALLERFAESFQKLRDNTSVDAAAIRKRVDRLLGDADRVSDDVAQFAALQAARNALQKERDELQADWRALREERAKEHERRDALDAARDELQRERDQFWNMRSAMASLASKRDAVRHEGKKMQRGSKRGK